MNSSILNITLLLDSPTSFLHAHVSNLINEIKEKGHDVTFCDDPKKITSGDMLFLLGCKTILTKQHLSLNKYNLVIHPSKLPEGRGSAALVWKILEGENLIYLTLFEANESVDRGDIYLQEKIQFHGYELSDEIRRTQGIKTQKMVLKFIDNYKNLKPIKQDGTGTFYKKRVHEDSEIDVNKSIASQFNLLRVVDNKRYPAFFYYKGHKYVINIYRKDKDIE